MNSVKKFPAKACNSSCPLVFILFYFIFSIQDDIYWSVERSLGQPFHFSHEVNCDSVLVLGMCPGSAYYMPRIFSSHSQSML